MARAILAPTTKAASAAAPNVMWFQGRSSLSCNHLNALVTNQANAAPKIAALYRTWVVGLDEPSALVAV